LQKKEFCAKINFVNQNYIFMSQNKLTTFFHNNLIATIIAALIVGGGLTALGFSAYNSGAKSVQDNVTATTASPQPSSSTIKSSSVSSSILSSSVISSSSAVEVKKEKAEETQKASEVKNTNVVEPTKIEKKTYTNQYYPGLQINYDSSWKLEKENVESDYKGLLDGTLKFVKSNQELKVELKPYSRGSCGPIYGQQPGLDAGISLKEKVIVTSNVYRDMWEYNKSKADPMYLIEELEDMTPKNAFQYFTFNSYACNLGNLETNIKTSDIPDYLDFFKTGKVNYSINITYKGDPTTFEQADQIIKDSFFPVNNI
jgi:hypothetical protein